jgi:hypothetical protein
MTPELEERIRQLIKAGVGGDIDVARAREPE